MKKTIVVAVIIMTLFAGAAGARAESASAERWLQTNFAKGAMPPFSFVYGARSSDTFIKSWDYEALEPRQLDSTRTQYVFVYTDPKTKLQVRAECVLFRDFPALEWVLKIRNGADGNSPIIEDVQAFDTVFKSEMNRYFVLHHALGGSITRQDFAPVETPVFSQDSIQIIPARGKSSSITALPFFNLESKHNGGVMIAIGWTGRWAATFNGVDDNAQPLNKEITSFGDTEPPKRTSSVRARVGMAVTHVKLFPGEEFRTPRIMLMFWSGDDFMTGQNMFRKIVLAHYTPHADGKPVMPPVSFSVHGTYVFNDTTEENMVELAKLAAEKFKNVGFEYFWIDAGWYEGGWPDGVGNMRADPKRFPRGLAPVGKAAQDNGFKFLLWIEPERVHLNTQIDREHPSWVLKWIESPTNGLLNLGNKKARRWITDTVSDLIDTAHISLYRQDFNMDPIQHWSRADVRSRQGMTEIRHVEGLYEFWDELLRRHPGLIIDNCASGGRRLDLEMISRSVALWRSDYTDINDPFMPDGLQSQTYGLGFWLPPTSTGTGTLDKYHFRSTLSAGMVISWNPKQPDFPIRQAEELASELQRSRKYFYGDFYPLTGYSTAQDVWIAYQFHRDDLNEGIALAFRRADNKEPRIRVRLRGLDPGAVYELEYSGENNRFTKSGRELMEGLDITREKPRDSALIFYKKKQAG